MRACHSGAAFAMAFPHCTQQAFLEAHAQAFDWFGGVFGLVRYDNLASAVKQVLRAAGAWRPTGSSRCARTTFTSRSSRSRGSRAPMKRAASRARSGVSAVVISSRCPRSLARGAERAAARRVRGGSGAADRWAPGDVGEASRGSGRCCAGCRPSGHPQRSRPRQGWTRSRWSRSSQNRYSVPVAWPGCGCTPGRCARDHSVTAASGSLSMSACRAASAFRPAGPLPRAGRAQAGRTGRLGGARPGARARRLAVLFDELWGRSPSATGPRRPPGRWSTC